jgi:outer membrane protein assembly factor BamB
MARVALVGLWALAAAGCASPETTLPSATSSASATSLSSSGCTFPNPSPYSGAPAALGLDARGAAAPVWSARIGSPQAVEGDRSFGFADEDNSGTACLVATDLAGGQIQWVTEPPAAHPQFLGVIADSTTVLAAVGTQFGQAPAAVGDFTTGLVAYDPVTGAPRWTFSFPQDGQTVPAVLAGGVVVVTEADGTVVGLDEGDGHQLWRDPTRETCPGWQAALGPDTFPVGPLTLSGTGQTLAVVGYGCLTTGGVEALNPMVGSRVWDWDVPEGWSLDTQMLTTVDTGSATGEVVVLPISRVPPANAPPVTAPAPTPAVSTVIHNPYGYSQTNDVVVLDPTTGEPLWDLQGVPGLAVKAIGGLGSLCILTDNGADCRAAGDGTPRWSTSWPGKNASSSAPALSCVCAASASGLLFLALAANSAPAYPLEWYPTTPAGAFLLTALDLATGRTEATLTLPAFSVQSDHAVSLAMPPAVLLAAGGMVLVSPQFEETDVVEAFAVTTSP